MTDSRAAGLLLMNTRSSNLSKKRFSITREVFFGVFFPKSRKDSMRSLASQRRSDVTTPVSNK